MTTAIEVGEISKRCPCRAIVVRYPSGRWGYGGQDVGRTYDEEGIEVYRVSCPSFDEWFDPMKIVRKAQTWRSRQRRNDQINSRTQEA